MKNGSSMKMLAMMAAAIGINAGGGFPKLKQSGQPFCRNRQGRSRSRSFPDLNWGSNIERKFRRLAYRRQRDAAVPRGMNRTLGGIQFEKPLNREQRISAAKDLAHQERMVVRDFAFYLRGIAFQTYRLADAMLAEREKKGAQ